MCKYELLVLTPREKALAYQAGSWERGDIQVGWVNLKNGDRYFTILEHGEYLTWVQGWDGIPFSEEDIASFDFRRFDNLQKENAEATIRWNRLHDLGYGSSNLQKLKMSVPRLDWGI